jgi:plastocyanin
MTYRIGWLVTSITLVAATSGIGAGRPHRMVIVPESDRFTPFSMTIRPGESVEWVNDDPTTTRS